MLWHVCPEFSPDDLQFQIILIDKQAREEEQQPKQRQAKEAVDINYRHPYTSQLIKRNKEGHGARANENEKREKRIGEDEKKNIYIYI